jgi:hypothetical protein
MTMGRLAAATLLTACAVSGTHARQPEDTKVAHAHPDFSGRWLRTMREGSLVRSCVTGGRFECPPVHARLHIVQTETSVTVQYEDDELSQRRYLFASQPTNGRGVWMPTNDSRGEIFRVTSTSSPASDGSVLVTTYELSMDSDGRNLVEERTESIRGGKEDAHPGEREVNSYVRVDSDR